jgi:capsular polysaccharide biosynthesis protein
VSERLADASLHVPPEIIQGSATTSKHHRILSLQLHWPVQGELALMAQAVADELEENAGTYFQQLGSDTAFATLLDGPRVSQAGPDLRQRLEFPLRLILAFLAGLGLVFLWSYLDDSIRERRELEDMGLAVLGEIPRHR